VSRVSSPARHIIGHFREESLQAITCTGTDNTKQTAENTPKTQKETKNRQSASNYILLVSLISLILSYFVLCFVYHLRVYCHRIVFVV